MSDRDTLLGHLVPKITSHVEDAATDALAYILNTSCEAMGALNDLLQHGGFKIEPIRRVRTQVSYEEGSSRPDMTGEDNRGVRRLVESKFGAPLLDGQASDYIKLLDKPGPAVLLFIAPEARSETLWAAIRRQMNESDLEEVASTSEESVQRVKVLGTERHLMLISWLVLLDRIAARVSVHAVREDIRQLRGLAASQDAEAFLPIHAEHLDPEIGRRVVAYNQIVDAAVDDRGVKCGWMDISKARATAQSYGYGRYFGFIGVLGHCWFGINHERWARKGDTPLWLFLSDDVPGDMDEIGRELDVRVEERWVPIHPKKRAERAEVLDDVVRQLKAIAGVVGAHT